MIGSIFLEVIDEVGFGLKNMLYFLAPNGTINMGFKL